MFSLKRTVPILFYIISIKLYRNDTVDSSKIQRKNELSVILNKYSSLFILVIPAVILYKSAISFVCE